MNSQLTSMQIEPSLEQSSLLQQLISPGDVILELGSFSSSTTKALLSRRCRCYVEDLPEFLDEMQVHDDFDFEESLRQHMSITDDDVKIDVVLTWDLFHYLDLVEIKDLFKILGPKIGPGTIIHSTRYTGRDIPERPQLFKLSNDLSYQVIEKKSDKRIANHSHTTIDLLTELMHFNLNDTLTHSDTVNRGLVEYSLIYSESRQKPKPVRRICNETIPLATQQLAESIKLPNLTKYLSSHSEDKVGCIIDCGDSGNSNYDLLSSCSNFVLEEDVSATLAWQKKVSLNKDYSIDEQLLNYRASVNFDLVLMWDLVNYCEPEQFAHIVDKLRNHMSKNSLLHFVLPHTGNKPSSPASFNIAEHFNVKFSGVLSGSGNQDVISTGQLVRLLPGFRVLAYYFGTQENGQNYQEYFFQYL
ncbi:MAG: hypothetical protein KUG78_03545 [Kangiellaceae bacterium]|nr:hypothetical protein [Kangiellaceae bacterium]